MQEHPLIELYVSLGDTQQSSSVEELVGKVNLDALVSHTLQAVGITDPVMLTLLITDDESIQELNQQYREQNKPTDVLSFRYRRSRWSTRPSSFSGNRANRSIPSQISFHRRAR